MDFWNNFLDDKLLGTKSLKIRAQTDYVSKPVTQTNQIKAKEAFYILAVSIATTKAIQKMKKQKKQQIQLDIN